MLPLTPTPNSLTLVSTQAPSLLEETVSLECEYLSLLTIAYTNSFLLLEQSSNLLVALCGERVCRFGNNTP